MPKTIKMGSWLVFPDRNTLTFQDEDHNIEPLAMDVLVYFSQNPQKVVSRSELIEAVWGGRVVGDHSVYRIINKLRQILARDPDQEYIKTIRKKGYQLVCDVSIFGSLEETITEVAHTSEHERASQSELARSDRSEHDTELNKGKLQKRSLWWRSILWGLLLLIVCVVVFLSVKLYFYYSMTSYSRSTPLLTLDGAIRDPSFSPDGHFIAFSYRESVEDDWDIYVESLVDGRLYQITDDITDELSPSWSPDGRKVAILRYDNQRCMIDAIAVPVSASSSASPEETEASTLVHCSGVLQHNSVAWGKEGRYLYYTSASSKVSPLQVFRLTIKTGKTEQLTNYTQGETRGALGIKLSPENNKLAILSDVNWRNSRIDLLDLESNSVETVRQLVGWNRYFDWSIGGEIIIYNRNSTEIDAYHVRMDVERNIAKNVEPISFPTHSTTKHEMVVVTGRKVVNIVAESLGEGVVTEQKPLTIITSSSIDNYAEYANTSDRIVFVSRRTGKPQIWLKNRNGTEHQLTSFERNFDIRRIRWSPDDDSLLFIHNNFLYQLALSNKELTVLYKAQDGESIEGESWADDGRSVLFSSDRDGDWQVYKLSLQAESGDVIPEQLTQKGGYAAFESPDQEGIFFLKYHTKGLWFKGYGAVMDGSEKEIRVIDNIDVFSWNSIYLRQNNIYYLSNDYPKMSIYRYNLSEQKRYFVQSYYGSPWLLSVSHQADKILYQRNTQTQSSLVLLKP
ncbi:winged helix-turn-helix domain-containing protein [Kangiella sp.]|uniref:winged helix-turn-helix domain-containing protein n=1 Tax=Kangiella sp. TaxID=1920245 RepID=UPI003A8DDFCB